MNCSQIKLENFIGKVNQCLTPAIYPYGSKGRNPPKSFHQAGEKVVASFGQTVAFCQVICNMIVFDKFSIEGNHANL